MSNGNSGDWYNRATKNPAVYKVLRYLAKNPDKGLACVGKDSDAQKLFEQQGGITVPTDKGARVIFFASGERDSAVGSSVIIEVPPANMPAILRDKDPTNEQLKMFILGNYEWWAV